MNDKGEMLFSITNMNSMLIRTNLLLELADNNHPFKGMYHKLLYVGKQLEDKSPTKAQTVNSIGYKFELNLNNFL